jgi:rare lipoprotein A
MTPFIQMRVIACRALAAASLAGVLLLASGCANHNTNLAQYSAPQMTAPAPEPEYGGYREYVPPPQPRIQPQARIAPTPVPYGGISAEDVDFVNSHRPIMSQVGMATWYTAPYTGRKAANGEVFDDHALTAAHRTLPLGSLIRVTNLSTGQSSAMRVTDRGPFVDNRVIDLTIASAKATGIYRSGMAQVRVDVYQTPKSLERGGRWCVQIGAFRDEVAAERLKLQLMRKYPTSKVIEFPGEASYWIRIRPANDNLEQAQFIASHLQTTQAEAFLTRLD